jgi:hypothetical protein
VRQSREDIILVWEKANMSLLTELGLTVALGLQRCRTYGAARRVGGFGPLHLGQGSCFEGVSVLTVDTSEIKNQIKAPPFRLHT